MIVRRPTPEQKLGAFRRSFIPDVSMRTAKSFVPGQFASGWNWLDIGGTLGRSRSLCKYQRYGGQWRADEAQAGSKNRGSADTAKPRGHGLSWAPSIFGMVILTGAEQACSSFVFPSRFLLAGLFLSFSSTSTTSLVTVSTRL
jgi:hypothetical protein